MDIDEEPDSICDRCGKPIHIDDVNYCSVCDTDALCDVCLMEHKSAGECK